MGYFNEGVGGESVGDGGFGNSGAHGFGAGDLVSLYRTWMTLKKGLCPTASVGWPHIVYLQIEKCKDQILKISKTDNIDHPDPDFF